MIKVCFISNIPSPYKVNLMNLIGEDVKLKSLFIKKNEEGRDSSWYNYNFSSFDVEYLNENAFNKIKQASEEYDLLINADYSNFLCIYATHRFKIKNKPVILLADGGLVIKRGIMDKIISLFMKQCDYYMSSGKEVNKYFNYYGIDSSLIYNYHFSSLNNLDLENNIKIIEFKENLRNKLNIKEKFVLLSIGQQIRRKGFDILVKSMINIPKDIGLYIVGGEVEEEVKKIVDDNKLDNIHFVGFKNKEELKEYYAASDCFILATRYDIWGLVINEAMSFKLPIISSDKCVAAVEFNNLFNNAIIVENEDIDGFTSSINMLYNDSELRKTLANNSVNGIKDYTIENTKKDFINIFNDVIKRYYGKN